MQTLRKKNSPCKYKKEPTRFLGEGVSFKAKLIGILEVSEARGDRMCQAALADLKMAIRAAGEHKQRIAVQVSIDGLRLRDEKSGECLYHHPVHKISFIAQDMSDSRAFGYIFGSPDTGHRFFGIKTDKAANQVVIAMRDLFQVVFELKKKEIELAKHHIDQHSAKFHTNSIFVEPAPDTKGAAGAENCMHRVRLMNAESGKLIDKPTNDSDGVMADLLDLQIELSSIQQGIHQMDKLTPDHPRSSLEDSFESDPFGDSFINMKVQDSIRPILPPPPSSLKRGHSDRQHSSMHSNLPKNSTLLTSQTSLPSSEHWLEKDRDKNLCDNEIQDISNTAYDEKKNHNNSVLSGVQDKSPQIDVFTELDPLGTGLSKPYIDKKDFFQHLKNPPKRVLKDLVTTTSSDIFPTHFNVSIGTSGESISDKNNFEESISNENFADFGKFEILDKNISLRNEVTEIDDKKKITKDSLLEPVNLSPEDSSMSKWTPTKFVEVLEKSVTDDFQNFEKLSSSNNQFFNEKKSIDSSIPANCKNNSIDKSCPIDYSIINDSPASPLRSCSSDANSRLSSSSAELDVVPEPPPRSTANVTIDPPPLPPKQSSSSTSTTLYSRPAHDFGNNLLKKDEMLSSSVRNDEIKDHQDITTIFKTHKPTLMSKDTDEFKMTDNMNRIPSSVQQSSVTTVTSSLLTSLVHQSLNSANNIQKNSSFNDSLNNSASSKFAELATYLNMNVSDLTTLTLQQLSECIAKLQLRDSQQSIIPVDDSKETNDSDQFMQPKSSKPDPKPQDDENYDKYAVFRELLEIEHTDQNVAPKDTPQVIEDDEKDKIEENIECENEKKIEFKMQTCNESHSDVLKSDDTKHKNSEIIPKKDESNVVPTRFESVYSPEKIDDVESKPEKAITEHSTVQTNTTDYFTDVINESSDKTESRSNSTALNDKYAALREIAIEKEPINEESFDPIESFGETTKNNIDQDLMKIFSVSQSMTPSPTNNNQKNMHSQAVSTNIFEEIKMLNNSSSKGNTKNMSASACGFEDVFCPFTNPKKVVKESKNHNWAKFDIDAFQSDKHRYEKHSSSKGTSPWSPEEKEMSSESVFKISTNRHSGESDNEWKDEEESEESNGIPKEGRFYNGKHSRLKSSCGKMVYYDSMARMSDSERHCRERMNKEMYEMPWDKYNHRFRLDSSPWHEDERWEDEHRIYTLRKNPYEEDECMAHRKCRNSQRSPWLGERDAYRMRDHSLYENDRSKRRMPLWSEDDRDQEKFSSQESMGYDDDDRWSRREYEKKRREEDSRFWGRHGVPDSNYPVMYRKHNPHYYRNNREHLPCEYSLSWEKDHCHQVDHSHKYSFRKRNWPKRPNSANEDRHIDVICTESRVKYGVSKSECSDNDLEHYRPYRSRSRESYWDSDQEFDSWGDKFYWPADVESKNESVNRKRMLKYKQPETSIKSQNSLFEDDFLQPEEQPSTGPINCKPSPDNLKRMQSSSHEQSINECMNYDLSMYGQSSFFKSDLKKNSNASSEDPSSHAPESNVNPRLDGFPSNIKDSPPIDDSVSDEQKASAVDKDIKINENVFVLKPDVETDANIGVHLKHPKQTKCHSNKFKEHHGIKKSESVNIFIRENDPFDDDDFFN
ncbi:uncharacterized protein Dab [Chelonus insularis]|uniref:uncharacterized protein Dab n=1 Tax=Chelonus insularis TaxID=460826 RepID=UPI00158DC1CB|nr:uncharacterized protein LOC118067965 [Chelonus insularis]